MEYAVLHQEYMSAGDTGYVYTYQVPSSVPLYRAWRSSAGDNDNFYTINATEMQHTIATQGYVTDGITAYVYTSDLCGSVSLYRAYSQTNTDHYYTTSLTERDTAIDVGGYVDEGIVAYIFPPT